MEHRAVQQIAKDTMEYIKTEIKAGMNLLEVRRLCEQKMLSLGADSFWYWDIGAFVFSGDETCVSVSGKKYKTTDRIIEENDIITIDLSPQNEGVWGDYARTVIIEDGNVVYNIEDVKNTEWKSGLKIEELLHKALLQYATPDTTYEQLYYYMNDFIVKKGFVNLDFMGNLGHSIERQKADRVYIEKGNTAKLGSRGFFTFEPHISTSGSKYGYKKENIYYFQQGILLEL